MLRYILPFLILLGCNKRESVEIPPASFDRPTDPIPQPRDPPRPGFQTVDLVVLRTCSMVGYSSRTEELLLYPKGIPFR